MRRTFISFTGSTSPLFGQSSLRSLAAAPLALMLFAKAQIANSDRWITKINSTLRGEVANPPKIALGAGNEGMVTIYWQHPEEAKLSPAPPHQYRAIASIN
jgi:hypothetical protein